jgi:hypothetical protein
MNMKILLNLLPNEKKVLSERRMHFRFLVWQMFLLFGLEVFFFAILMAIALFLNFEQKHQETLGQDFNRFQEEEKKLKLYEEKFREMNDRVRTTSLVNKNHYVFTNIFVLLDRHVSQAITLERVSTKDRQVFLFGTADTRDDLILFDEALKREDCFSEVKLPLSNLLSQKDVAFQFDIMLKESCLHDMNL